MTPSLSPDLVRAQIHQGRDGPITEGSRSEGLLRCVPAWRRNQRGCAPRAWFNYEIES